MLSRDPEHTALEGWLAEPGLVLQLCVVRTSDVRGQVGSPLYGSEEHMQQRKSPLPKVFSR